MGDADAELPCNGSLAFTTVTATVIASLDICSSELSFGNMLGVAAAGVEVTTRARSTVSSLNDASTQIQNQSRKNIENTQLFETYSQ